MAFRVRDRAMAAVSGGGRGSAQKDDRPSVVPPAARLCSTARGLVTDNARNGQFGRLSSITAWWTLGSVMETDCQPLTSRGPGLRTKPRRSHRHVLSLCVSVLMAVLLLSSGVSWSEHATESAAGGDETVEQEAATSSPEPSESSTVPSEAASDEEATFSASDVGDPYPPNWPHSSYWYGRVTIDRDYVLRGRWADGSFVDHVERRSVVLELEGTSYPTVVSATVEGTSSGRVAHYDGHCDYHGSITTGSGTPTASTGGNDVNLFPDRPAGAYDFQGTVEFPAVRTETWTGGTSSRCEEPGTYSGTDTLGEHFGSANGDGTGDCASRYDAGNGFFLCISPDPEHVMGSSSFSTPVSPWTHSYGAELVSWTSTDVLTASWDLVAGPSPTPEPEPIPGPTPVIAPSGPGEVASTCGQAKFDWYTSAQERTFVDEGEPVCTYLVSNTVAMQLLAVAEETGKSLGEVFGAAALAALMEAYPEYASQALLESTSWVTEKVVNRQVSNWVWTKTFGEAVAKGIGRANLIVNVGEAVGLAVVPMTAAIIYDQIENKGACIQVTLGSDGGNLGVDWNLVYNPAHFTDQSMTNVTVHQKVERKFAFDDYERVALDLTCDASGAAFASGGLSGEVLAKAGVAAVSTGW